MDHLEGNRVVCKNHNGHFPATQTSAGETSYDMASLPPLRVVLLTPPGRGAVATVRIEGAGACERVDRQFQAASHRPVAELAGDRLAFGRFRLGEGVYDEVIVRRPEENVVEIHCHGGPAVVERLMAALVAEDGERISAEDWIRSVHSSPVVAAAHAALGRATTLRAAAVLLDQFHGALDRALQKILDHLRRGEVHAADDRVERLLAIAPCGCHLTKPWLVVLAGRPNVGKSSLINALVGYRRAIVHESPGTTRDLVTAKTAIDGWPVELCDTAGLRMGPDAVEQQGIELALRQLESASLVLLVFDVAEPWCEEDAELCRRFPNALLVFNKTDLPQASARSRPAGVSVSAIHGEGIDDLVAAIAHRLVPNPPASGQPVPFLGEHAAALQAASTALNQGATDQAAEWVASLLSR